MLLLGGECKPFVTPPNTPSKSPPLEGTGLAGRTWKSTGQRNKKTVAKWTPGSSLLQRQRVDGLSPLPSPPSRPGAPPPYTLHLQGNLVLSAGAFIFLGEGGGKDSPLGNPFPGAPLKMVCYFLGSRTSPCPPGPTPGCGPVGTQALKTSSWI